MWFILDSHPDMACGPETNVAHTFAKLVLNGATLESAESAATRVRAAAARGQAGGARHDRPDVRALPGAARDEAVARQVAGHPCVRRADDAHVPWGRFICLFRHCMDVIASGVEATPWGLPGDGAGPGIAELVFKTAHERGGPSDPKIWFTRAISSGSVGCGVSVPAEMLSPAMRGLINETLAKLGCRLVDDEWNVASAPRRPAGAALVRPAPTANGPRGRPGPGSHHRRGPRGVARPRRGPRPTWSPS